MYSDHTYCRACGCGKPELSTLKVSAAAGPQGGPSGLVPVFDLGVQPLANDFTKPTEERAGHVPLKVMLCPKCHLAQLSVVVNPLALYSHYAYVTSPSETMKEHFAHLRNDLMEEAPQSRSLLEIGSNDGTLLLAFKDSGMRVEGIDPAENLGKAAAEKGILTTLGLFGEKSASSLGKFDLVIARHVFCHVDDWQDFVKGLEHVSTAETLIAIETPYVQDLLDKCEFDTVYHEHLSYLSLKSIVALLKDSPLQLHRVIRYPIHGGAVCMLLSRRDSGRPVHHSVQQFLDAEDVGPEKWARMAVGAQTIIESLGHTVRDLRQQGKTVAALGASAKFTVMANACGFTRKDISFVADTTLQKWYSTVPGTGIPVVDEGAILRDLPDYVLVGCWNFRAEVLHKNQLARSKGVKFIFPVPSIEVV